MNLHEYQAKKLLSDFNVPIQRGRVVDNLDDLIKIVDTKIYGRSKILFGTFNWVIFLLKFLLVQQQVDRKDLISKDCQ